MSQEQDVQQQEEAAPEIAADFEAQCPSLTGRSTLTYQVGRLKDGAGMQFRIARNTGKGMFCKDWAPVSVIDALLAKASEVSARTFNEVHPGKSINTGGFILAVLKDLGVVKPKGESRQHERVPGASLQ